MRREVCLLCVSSTELYALVFPGTDEGFQKYGAHASRVQIQKKVKRPHKFDDDSQTDRLDTFPKPGFVLKEGRIHSFSFSCFLATASVCIRKHPSIIMFKFLLHFLHQRSWGHQAPHYFACWSRPSMLCCLLHPADGASPKDDALTIACSLADRLEQQQQCSLQKHLMLLAWLIVIAAVSIQKAISEREASTLSKSNVGCLICSNVHWFNSLDAEAGQGLSLSSLLPS